MPQRSLHKGHCIKCDATTIKVRTLSFGSTRYDKSRYEPSHFVRVFVCATCGYTEVFTRPQELAAIARSREWDAVPYTRPPHEYTGETIRLVPPEDTD